MCTVAVDQLLSHHSLHLKPKKSKHMCTHKLPYSLLFSFLQLASFSRHPALHDILSLDPFLKKLQESCGFRVTRTLLFPLSVVWWLSIIPSL